MDISIDPSKSLIRICRFCLNPMILIHYEFDTEFRWFSFYCEECDHGTTLGEPIGEDVCPNYEDGSKHEPLTYEELQHLEDSNDTTPIATVTSEDGEIYVDFSKKFKEENR